MNKSLEALKKYFNFDEFRPAQEEIILAILSGENVLAVLPTGAGKSICYQLPSLISDGFSIVVSPLIALMKDQVDALNKNEQIGAFINSTMSFREAEIVLQKIAYGSIKLLYVAPERLENMLFAERIKNLKPSFLFIDEAHCISEWGHNFRPGYAKIKDFIKFTGIKKISAFTATATPEVEKDIIKQLELKDVKIFVRGFERENLNLNVVLTQHKIEKCMELIREYKTPAIIYTSSRKSAEEITEHLVMNRINCGCYHAGMRAEIRKKIHEDFLEDKLSIIAATNAFGMGIDKKDIRLIIHYNIPGTIENYYQEIGRAGRDGKEANIYLLYNETDIDIQKFFIENSHPDKELIQNVYAGICDYSRIAEGTLPNKELPVNLQYLTAYAKREISKGLLHASLKALERGGYLREVSEFENLTSLQFVADKEKLKNFIKKTNNISISEAVLFLIREHGSLIFRQPVNISLAHIAASLKMENEELQSALTTIDNLGLAEFKIPSGGENVKLLQHRVNASRLNLDYKRINENYLNQQNKLDKMVDYVYTHECRFKYILNYFGEETENYRCGRCDKCLIDEKLSDSTTDYIKEIILRTLNDTGGMLTDNAILMIVKGHSKIRKYNLLPTFGGCANYDINDLKHILSEMISEKLLKKDKSGGKIIMIDEKGFVILKMIEPEKEFKKEEIDYEKNLELYNLLTDVRKKAAVRFGQSVDIICPNPTLIKIAEVKPKTKGALFNIEGINHRMFNKIGDEILEVIKEFGDGEKLFSGEETKREEEKSLPPFLSETLDLLKKKYSLKDIASLRNLTEAVISMQIETILEYYPATDITYLFENNTHQQILDEIKKGFKDLKELKGRVPKEVTFPLIRIAVAKIKVSSPPRV